MKPLTPKQKKTLDHVKRFISARGYAPSIQEIANKFSISHSAAWERLNHLEEKGWIERKKHGTRWIILK